MTPNETPHPVVDEAVPLNHLNVKRVSSLEVLLRVMQEDNRAVQHLFTAKRLRKEKSDMLSLPVIAGLLATGPAIYGLYKVVTKFSEVLKPALGEMDADLSELEGEGFSEEEIVEEASSIKKKFDDLVGSKKTPETVATPKAKATPIATKTAPTTVNRSLPTPSPEIANTLKRASKTHGIDYETLYSFAGAESSFRANADASTSSASGLLQFTSGTWDYLTKKVYPEFGYKPNDRKDPAKAAHIASLYIGRLQSSLKRNLKRDPSIGETYLAYVLGPTGAIKFLAAKAKDPKQQGAKLFSSAAKANPNLFYRGGEPMTLDETFAKVSGKIEGFYNVAKASSQGSTVASAPVSSDEAQNARPTVAKATPVPVLPGVESPQSPQAKATPVKLDVSPTKKRLEEEDDEIAYAEDTGSTQDQGSMQSPSTAPRNQQRTYVRDRQNRLVSIPG